MTILKGKFHQSMSSQGEACYLIIIIIIILIIVSSIFIVCSVIILITIFIILISFIRTNIYFNITESRMLFNLGSSSVVSILGSQTEGERTSPANSSWNRPPIPEFLRIVSMPRQMRRSLSILQLGLQP